MRRSRTMMLGALGIGFSAALAGCDEAPPPQSGPVLMTEQNRPTFTSRDECARRFGEEHCEQGHGGGGGFIYRSYYSPGATYYYPYGTGGYYAGSPHANPATTPAPAPRAVSSEARGSSAPISSTAHAPATSGGRGGFGSGAAAHGGASG